jgi:hypothetical protein
MKKYGCLSKTFLLDGYPGLGTKARLDPPSLSRLGNDED